MEVQVQFSVKDLMALDFIHEKQKVPTDLAHRLPVLLDAGVIESVGRGRETQYMLARNFYAFADRKGLYTRRKGLDKEQNKALILKHINNFGTGTLEEFRQVLPALSRNQVRILLQELKEAGDLTFEGASPRYGSWKRS
jgi:ATP-dependent DNA helicase RecG